MLLQRTGTAAGLHSCTDVNEIWQSAVAESSARAGNVSGCPTHSRARRYAAPSISSGGDGRGRHSGPERADYPKLENSLRPQHLTASTFLLFGRRMNSGSRHPRIALCLRLSFLTRFYTEGLPTAVCPGTNLRRSAVP